MKSCAEIELLVTSFLDEEIAVTERDLVERHLEQCPVCRRRTDQQRIARTVVRLRAPHLVEPASPALRSRCTALRGRFASPVARTARPLAGWLPASVAAAVAMAASAALLFGLLSRLEVGLAAQLTADHVKCFALRPSHASGDTPATIAARFQQSNGWNIAVPSGVRSDDLELVTARRCLYGEGLMAHVMYDWHGVPLSLFVLPGTQRASRLFQMMGHEAIIWPDKGNTYALVGTASPAEMQQLAERVRDRVRDAIDSRR